MHTEPDSVPPLEVRVKGHIESMIRTSQYDVDRKFALNLNRMAYKVVNGREVMVLDEDYLWKVKDALRQCGRANAKKPSLAIRTSAKILRDVLTESLNVPTL